MHKRDVAHIPHASRFLKPGGRMLWAASTGVMHRSERVHCAFREWLDDYGRTFEELPEGSFSESGTEVSTVLVSVRVPGGNSDGGLIVRESVGCA